MGKRIIQQRRGRGTSTYRAHSFRFAGKTSYNAYNKDGTIKGEIIDLIHSKGHSAPLLKVKYENGKEALIPSFEGAYIGKELMINQEEQVKREEVEAGNAYLLKNIPEGTQIFNIEMTPGDSGKLVKTGGTFATVVAHNKGMTKVTLPSKKTKLILGTCRAFVGQIGGGSRLEKPYLKAGAQFMQMKKKSSNLKS